MNDVPVRKNSGTYIGGRDRLNFIEGSGVSLTVADDAANGEVDITVAATIAGLSVNSSSVSGNVDLDDATPAAPSGSVNVKWQKDASSPVNISAYLDGTSDLANNARIGVRKNSTGSTYKRRRINFIEGSNVTLTVADDSGDEEVDVTIAASGGGGTAYGWHPAKPPASPHASDDEFTSTGAGVPTGWTSWNPSGGTQTVSVVDYGLVIDYTDPGGAFSYSGVYKSIPADDEWEIVCDARVGTSTSNLNVAAGIAIWDDAAGAASTTDFTTVFIEYDGDAGCVKYSDYQSFSTVFGAVIPDLAAGGYCLIQYKASTQAIYGWYSLDGVAWVLLGSGTAGFDVSHMGIVVTAPAGNVRGLYDFFRVTRAAASGIIGTHPDPVGGRSA